MNNFIFNVQEIREGGNHTLIKGRHYSGLIQSGDKVFFASPAGGIECLTDDVAYAKHSSADMLVVNMPYSGTAYNANGKGVWAVDDSNSPCMVTDDAFDIAGRGIVLTGVVAFGTIRVGDKMSVITPSGVVHAVEVTGIEYFRQLKDTANKGESVGILLSGIRSKHDVPSGSLLCRPLTSPTYDIQAPEQDDAAFVVKDIFTLKDQRIVVDGYVHASKVRVGDVMTFRSFYGKTHIVRISGIVIQKRVCDAARNGDYVGLLLDGINDCREISIGDRMYLKNTTHVNPQPQYHEPAYDSNNHSGQPGGKVALLIGNSNYGGDAQLKNPINDARALGHKLQELGFKVILVEDGDKQAIDSAFNLLYQKTMNADVGFVFYSGHGMQYNGENYMIPIGARFSSPSDIEYNCNNASYALAKLEDAGCKLKIMILDACRVNPFTRGWCRGDTHQGLGVMGAPSGTIVAYATSPNCVAYDGCGGLNSPYTLGLLKYLDDADLDIVSYFNRVSSYVYRLTQEQQNPWFSCSALSGEFFLAGGNRTQGHEAAPSLQVSHAEHHESQPSVSSHMKHGFMMQVDRVYEVGEEEVVLSGTIEHGGVSVGDKVYLNAKGKELLVQYVSAIESGGHIVKTASRGNRVGLKFKGVYTWQLEGCDSVLRDNL